MMTSMVYSVLRKLHPWPNHDDVHGLHDLIRSEKVRQSWQKRLNVLVFRRTGEQKGVVCWWGYTFLRVAC